jgi:hypothetical protein
MPNGWKGHTPNAGGADHRQPDAWPLPLGRPSHFGRPRDAGGQTLDILGPFGLNFWATGTGYVPQMESQMEENNA